MGQKLVLRENMLINPFFGRYNGDGPVGRLHTTRPALSASMKKPVTEEKQSIDQ